MFRANPNCNHWAYSNPNPINLILANPNPEDFKNLCGLYLDLYITFKDNPNFRPHMKNPNIETKYT